MGERGETAVTEADLAHLRASIAVAAAARAGGDHPFGAVLVTADGRVFDGGNRVNSDRDPTAHAETALVRVVSRELSQAELAGSTMYASTEPCAMCAGAIVWSGIGRLVFGFSGHDLVELVAGLDGPSLDLPSRAVFAAASGEVLVAGPLLADEARVVHEGFWRAAAAD